MVIAADYVTVRNITFDGSAYAGAYGDFTPAIRLGVKDATLTTGIIIEGCSFRHLENAGIRSLYADDFIIRYNHIYDVRTRTAGAGVDGMLIGWHAEGGVIEGNIIEDVGARSINFDETLKPGDGQPEY